GRDGACVSVVVGGDEVDDPFLEQPPGELLDGLAVAAQDAAAVELEQRAGVLPGADLLDLDGAAVAAVALGVCDDGVPAGGADGADDAGRIIAQVEAELDQRVARAPDAEAGGGEGGFGGARVRGEDLLPELELRHVRAARA